MIYIALLTVIFFQLFLIIYPLVKRKFGQDLQLLKIQDVNLIKKKVLQQAYKMLASKSIKMSFNDEDSLYTLLATWKSRLLGRKSHHIYTYFNFPLAFLLLGFLDQYDHENESEALEKVEIKIADLITSEGQLKFKVDKADQATLGLVFLRLYQITNKGHYFEAAKNIYKYISLFKKEDGLYLYRKEHDVFFIDTVGLVCPFLMLYAEITSNESIKMDAERQVQFALQYCIGPNQGLAFHAYDLINNQPLGSVNWARGMGWLLLGLSSVAMKSKDKQFKSAMEHYLKVLNSLKEDYGFWAQFLGHTNDKAIDSSGSLMFLYSFMKCGLINIDKSLIESLAVLCVDIDGKVQMVSGDTIYINKYSRVKGISELGQGILLSILAESKK
ncbi:glycoside hydrolase family 88 protein [Acinetobacter lwoffii]|uniref:glycoside hydrolase family 88 protein n=1 Tax=Acinetobacter lwoffii TaxID=28090 RepID=UPI0011DCA6CB|nr:glycoside hydrolase family 88 protein [Acinetobacter lwoffii]